MEFDLSPDMRVYVAGHGGLVGSAIWRHLTARGFTNLVGWRSAELDLRDRDATFDAVLAARPDVVIVAAAKVGGILANSTYPVDFLNDNLRIQTNLFEASHAADVDRLLFLGSSCIYPKMAPQPIPESALLTGPLEPTNDAYAIAKIAGIMAIKSYRHQYGRHWISAMPTNLYGPGDNFDLTSSHVLPAMIRKYHDAKVSGGSVTLWGTGLPRREFLHVDDLADAVVHLLRLLRHRRDDQRWHRHRHQHPRAGRVDRRCGRVPGRNSLGHVKARRDAAETARRGAAAWAGVGAKDRPSGGDHQHLPVVSIDGHLKIGVKCPHGT